MSPPNSRALRDLLIGSSLVLLGLACATGTIDEEDPDDGSSGRAPTAGAMNASGGGAGVSTGSGGAGQGGSTMNNAGSGSQSAMGGKGGTTGGAPSAGAGGTMSAGGSSGAGSTGGVTSTGGNQGQGGALPSGGMGGKGGSGGSLGNGGKGGSNATGGGPASGGTGSTGGSGGASGAGGSVGADAPGTGGSAGAESSACSTWPMANGSQSVSSTIQVSGTYDGEFKRFTGSGALGSGGQQENQPAMFELSNGATLKNVIIGSPAADGVHCEGSCTLENVWWEDVGEDAATFRGSSSSQQMTVRCGGAKNAMDKVFQHNGAGTLTIEDFQVEGFSKLYRSCGNCSSQYARHVVLTDVTARSGSTLVGINTNYGDTADFERITVYGQMTICERYTGNSSGAEPVRTGSGPDSEYCRYSSSDVTQR